MTIARWNTCGRALTLALLLLTFALPAAAQAMHEDGHTPRTPAGRVLARDEHRRLALKPAREALARKRAERRRAAREGAAPPAPAKPSLASRYDEDKPLDLPEHVEVGQARADTGGSLGRTLFGLMIVVALIYGLTLVLRRMRNGAIGGGGRSQGLKAVASIPLGPNRSIHLVRAGQEYLLVGAAEHGVVPLRTYTEDEARDAGLLDLDAGAAQQAARRVVSADRRSDRPKADLSTLLDDLRSRTVRR